MKNFILITAGVAIIAYFVFRPRPIVVEYANYKVSMQNIASYFRTLELIKGEDIPFVSSTNKDNKFWSSRKGIKIPKTPADKKSIIVGVYNEQTEKVSHLKMIIADDFDSEIENALSKGFVVLQ